MNTKKIVFLLVDDDKDDTDLFYDTVKSINPEISCYNVENGHKALEFFSQENSILPNVIFLDINMPVMNGFECLSHIRTIEKLKDIPVIIYSTASGQNNVERAHELGAQCFYVKPHEFDKISDFFKFVIENVDKDLLTALKIHQQFNLFNSKYFLT